MGRLKYSDWGGYPTCKHRVCHLHAGRAQLAGRFAISKKCISGCQTMFYALRTECLRHVVIDPFLAESVQNRVRSWYHVVAAQERSAELVMHSLQSQLEIISSSPSVSPQLLQGLEHLARTAWKGWELRVQIKARAKQLLDETMSTVEAFRFHDIARLLEFWQQTTIPINADFASLTSPDYPCWARYLYPSTKWFLNHMDQALQKSQPIGYADSTDDETEVEVVEE